MDNSDDDEFEDYYMESEGYVDDFKGDNDPEYFQFDCLTTEEVEQLLSRSVEKLCNIIEIAPSLATIILHTHGWDINSVAEKYVTDSESVLVQSKIKTRSPLEMPDTELVNIQCTICVECFPRESFCSLDCGHMFCKQCWTSYLQMKISEGISTNICCISLGCSVLALEDFVFSLVTDPNLRDRYKRFALNDHVISHPELRFCPGINCQCVIHAKEVAPKRVVCKFCKTTYCFKCGAEYHAPLDCENLKLWLTKCSDESETANYFKVNTKNCPNCKVFIDKDGGCNYIHCSKCEHNFCWVCLAVWQEHQALHQCSRYQEQPDENEKDSDGAKAKESLTKYLHYFERWHNHSRSLKLEEVTLARINNRIQDKVMSKCGTWIDWQYLMDAYAVLAKCRYTLQYSYPYAYYMSTGSRKDLFEYQQAQLEAEIENLAFKIERAETIDVKVITHQMVIADNRRIALLVDFFIL